MYQPLDRHYHRRAIIINFTYLNYHPTQPYKQRHTSLRTPCLFKSAHPYLSRSLILAKFNLCPKCLIALAPTYFSMIVI